MLSSLFFVVTSLLENFTFSFWSLYFSSGLFRRWRIALKSFFYYSNTKRKRNDREDATADGSFFFFDFHNEGFSSAPLDLQNNRKRDAGWVFPADFPFFSLLFQSTWWLFHFFVFGFVASTFNIFMGCATNSKRFAQFPARRIVM